MVGNEGGYSTVRSLADTIGYYGPNASHVPRITAMFVNGRDTTRSELMRLTRLATDRLR
jgi:hypothetical protein